MAFEDEEPVLLLFRTQSGERVFVYMTHLHKIPRLAVLWTIDFMPR